jgi:hypothetical protein
VQYVLLSQSPSLAREVSAEEQRQRLFGDCLEHRISDVARRARAAEEGPP